VTLPEIPTSQRNVWSMDATFQLRAVCDQASWLKFTFSKFSDLYHCVSVTIPSTLKATWPSSAHGTFHTGAMMNYSDYDFWCPELQMSTWLTHAVEKCTFSDHSLTSNKHRKHAKLHSDLVTMVLETDRASSQHVTTIHYQVW